MPHSDYNSRALKPTFLKSCHPKQLTHNPFSVHHRATLDTGKVAAAAAAAAAGANNNNNLTALNFNLPLQHHQLRHNCFLITPGPTNIHSTIYSTRIIFLDTWCHS